MASLQASMEWPLDWARSDAVQAALAGFGSLLSIWLFGAVVGLLLPRPKWLSEGTRPGALVLSPFLRRFVVAAEAALIVREVWSHYTHPGTFRGLVASIWRFLCGKGWTFQWPASAASVGLEVQPEEAEQKPVVPAVTREPDNWYVGEKDLAFFKYHAEECGPCEGASEWEVMMEKDVPGVIHYTAWRRTLPSGKTEYKSVTLAPNVTAEEFNDLYLDDSFRRNWDGMVIHHEVLEHGDFATRQMVVRWIRRFPFAFLSDREYTIARRVVRDPANRTIYGLTRAVSGHPREHEGSGVVKMDTFWSHWRSRDVPCPWGSGAPACETTLLHHEDFKIPERLARFAVRTGMWGFVRQLSKSTPEYVAARRARVDMHLPDPRAYGAGHAPNPPLRRADSARSGAGAGSSLSLVSLSAPSEWACASDPGVPGSPGSHAPAAVVASRMRRSASAPYIPRRTGGAKSLATLALAGGLALVLGAHGAKSGSSVGPRGHAPPNKADGKRRRRQMQRAQSAANFAE